MNIYKIVGCKWTFVAGEINFNFFFERTGIFKISLEIHVIALIIRKYGNLQIPVM